MDKGTVRLGPIALVPGDEPTIPSVQEQARVVADVIFAINQRTNHDIEIDREPYDRLRAGDLGAFFRQRTPEELEEYKRQIVMYDDVVLSRYLWPAEDQLLDWYQTATAYTWLSDHALPLTWAEWDRYRRKVNISQVESLQDLLDDPVAKRRAASDQANLLSQAAVELDGRTHSEVRSLAEALQKEMFLSDRIALPIHAALPVQMPEEVPAWAWRWGLWVTVPQWWDLKEQQEDAPDLPAHYPSHLQRMLSAAPYVVIDRASRDGRNWKYDPEEEIFPFFEDGRTKGIRLTYGAPSSLNADLHVAAQLAVEQVNRLDDRTADVWRVILWKATENGVSNSGMYTRIRIDTREVAQFLGYKKHHKGGMKPEHLLEVHNALLHLECMRIYISPEAKGTLEQDTGQAKGRRKAKQLLRVREEKVISVMAREGERNLFGQDCHMVWELALGDWARFFDRSYAPMFKALVELPSRSGVHKWAKRIGTELVVAYRQDVRGEKVKRLKWSTLLDRAGLMKDVEELRAARHYPRITKYAEGALDALREVGVLKQWNMAAQHEERLNEGLGKPGNFSAWLESIVEIHAPDEVLEILDAITPAKARRARRA